jgi:predicted GNAT family acetyltransferase
MKINQEDNLKKGRFFIEIENQLMAEITYTYAGNDKIIIDHTEVNPILKGKGIGYNLIDEVVSFVRENNLKIIPLCPFAAAVFRKKKEYSDILN